MQAKILHLRQQIDQIDQEISDLLSRRNKISREIGEVKRQEGLKVEDSGREKAVLSSKPAEQRQVFQAIMSESKKLQ